MLYSEMKAARKFNPEYQERMRAVPDTCGPRCCPQRGATRDEHEEEMQGDMRTTTDLGGRGAMDSEGDERSSCQSQDMERD